MADRMARPFVIMLFIGKLGDPAILRPKGALNQPCEAIGVAGRTNGAGGHESNE